VAGFDDHLVKPVSLNALRELLATISATKKEKRPAAQALPR
jgi:hypothetical protein